MESLLPYDEFTGGSSTRLHIAIEPQKNAQLVDNQVMSVSGAMGITKRIVPDIDLYSFLGGGIGYTGHSVYLYTAVETGTIIREVWNMKTLLSLTRTDNQVDLKSNYYTACFSQSKFLNSMNSLNLDWKLDMNEFSRRSLITITLKNIF